MHSYLKNIEQHIDQSLWLESEALFEKEGIIQSIEQVSRSLWNFVIKDQSQAQEVEILMVSPKPKFSCECSTFLSNRICKHIVLSLLQLRQIINEKEIEKARKKATRVQKARQKDSLNTKTVLSKSHPEELKRFVQSYANKDASFALALKGHFANKIDLEDNKEKYRQLLDSAVKPKTFKHKSLTPSEKRNFYRLADSLFQQANDCLSLGQFRECAYIVHFINDKIHYIKKNFNYNEERLLKMQVHFLDLLKELLGSKIPPELQNEIYKDSCGQILKSYYTPDERNLIETLQEFILFEKDDTEEIFEKFIQVKSDKTGETQKFHLALLKMSEKHEILFELIFGSLPLERISEALQKLYTRDKISLVAKWCDFLFKKEKSTKTVTLLNARILLDEGNVPKALAMIERLLKEYKDVNLSLGLINFISQEDIDDNKAQINAMFAEMHHSDRLKLYKKTNQLQLLIDTLHEEAEISDLWAFDDYIAEEDSELLYDTYKSMLEKYLQNYLGNAGKDGVVASLMRLNKLGFKKYSNSLRKELGTQFSHRKIIADILT